MSTFLSKLISYAKKDKADNQSKNKWESQVIQKIELAINHWETPPRAYNTSLYLMYLSNDLQLKFAVIQMFLIQSFIFVSYSLVQIFQAETFSHLFKWLKIGSLWGREST